MTEPGLFFLATTGGPSPAVAYVRRSTACQGHSTDKQLERIRKFAAHRGIKIMQVFADKGPRGETR